MDPLANRPRQVPLRLLLAGAALFLPVFLFSSFVLARDIQLLGSIPNAYFDMDVSRVVDDWTSWERSDRARTHPLYKFIAFLGMPLNALLFGGEGHDATGRILAVGFMLAALVLAGWLAWQVTGGSRRAAALAMLLFGGSYSTLLLATFPDSASASAFTSLLPYVYLFHRMGRRLGPGEMAGWMVIGLVCFGITITQVLHVLFALLYRFSGIFGAGERGTRARGWAMGALATAAAALLLYGAAYAAMSVKEVVFTGAEKHYRLDRVVEREWQYVETDEVREAPMARMRALTSHFLLYNFTAPEPGIETWSAPRDTRLFTSLTLLDRGWRDWPPWAWPLLASHAALLLLAIRQARPRPALLLLGAGIGFQFAMHFIYGREFIIYSPNWHTLICVLIAAMAAPALRRGRACGLLAWLGVHAAALLLFNLYSTHRALEVYRLDYPLAEVMEREERYRLEAEQQAPAAPPAARRASGRDEAPGGAARRPVR